MRSSMKTGDRVRVTTSIKVYHHPEHRNEAFDLKGMEGEVVDIIQDWHGRPISPNYPVLIKFGKKFKAHLSDREIEVIA